MLEGLSAVKNRYKIANVENINVKKCKEILLKMFSMGEGGIFYHSTVR